MAFHFLCRVKTFFGNKHLQQGTQIIAGICLVRSILYFIVTYRPIYCHNMYTTDGIGLPLYIFMWLSTILSVIVCGTSILLLITANKENPMVKGFIIALVLYELFSVLFRIFVILRLKSRHFICERKRVGMFSLLDSLDAADDEPVTKNPGVGFLTYTHFVLPFWSAYFILVVNSYALEREELLATIRDRVLNQ